MCVEEARNILKEILETESIVSHVDFISALEITLKLLDEHEAGKYTYPIIDYEQRIDKFDEWLSERIQRTRQGKNNKFAEFGEKDETYLELIQREAALLSVNKAVQGILIKGRVNQNVDR